MEMDRNDEFISQVALVDIPWHRLATTYGRATDFPRYFDTLLGLNAVEADSAGEQIALNIEHQSTLWPASPFAMIFLGRVLEKAFPAVARDASRRIVINLLEVFIAVATSCEIGDRLEHSDPLPLFADMLGEEYLWSVDYDEEEDEARYEKDGGPFSDDLFYSFYYYCDAVLKYHESSFQSYLATADDEIKSKLSELISLINRSRAINS